MKCRLQKFYLLTVVIIGLLVMASSTVATHAQDATTVLPRIAVSENRHFLITEDGKPFFWLGDTAWELLARLNEDQTLQYLDNRRDNGFNAIQVAILTEWSLDVPSAEGQI